MYWDTWFGSEQMILQIPVTADGVGGRKQVPFSFSFLPGLQRRQVWTCQLCTFDLDKTGALQWDFYDACREKFPFHFFSVLAGTVFSLSHTVFCLIPPPTCQGHGLNICVVLRGRRLWSAPGHCRQHCIPVFSQQQFSIFLQDHTVLCSFLLMGRPLSRGSWPGLGSCWEQPPAVSMTWASPYHCCNECV